MLTDVGVICWLKIYKDIFSSLHHSHGQPFQVTNGHEKIRLRDCKRLNEFSLHYLSSMSRPNIELMRKVEKTSFSINQVCSVYFVCIGT